jgi:hypothetical protein
MSALAQADNDAFSFRRKVMTESRIVEGVCLPVVGGHPDYDELLREALRVALRLDLKGDDWDAHYDRIRKLIDAYLSSPEGRGENVSNLMTRLASCAVDIIPMAANT